MNSSSATTPSAGSAMGDTSSFQRVRDLFAVTRTGIGAHNLGVAAAGVALFSFLAIVPTLIAAVSIYGLVSDPDEIAAQITDLASAIDDSEDGDGIGSLIESAIPSDSGSEAGVALAIGIGLALFSASAAIKNLLSTINFVFETPETRSFIKVRGMAIGALIGALVFMMGASFMLAALPRLLDKWGVGGGLTDLINFGRFPALGLVLVIGLSTLYHVAPNRSMGDFKWIRPGALVATAMWLAVSIALSLYFSSSAFANNASFAVFGSIIALLTWLNLSAMSVLVGAEVEAARSDRDSVGHPFAPIQSPRLGLAAFALAKEAHKSGEPVPDHVTPVGGNELLLMAPDLLRREAALLDRESEMLDRQADMLEREASVLAQQDALKHKNSITQDGGPATTSKELTARLGDLRQRALRLLSDRKR